VVAVQRPLVDHGANYDEFLAFREFAISYAKHNDISIRENYLVQRIVQSMEEYQGIPPDVRGSNKYDKLEIALRILQIPSAELLSTPTLYRDLILFLDETMIKGNSSRRLCATTQGYIGVCSYDARPGDKVALLHGVSMLMVLRPVAENSYEILGDAYFSGISNGDALKMPTYQPGEIFLV
jgi:hypothetical protein